MKPSRYDLRIRRVDSDGYRGFQWSEVSPDEFDEIATAEGYVRREALSGHPRFDQCKGRECLDGETVTVRVAADHSHTGQARDKEMPVDACIADLVRALYPLTASSCCGHGQTEGRILLYDGRVLRVYHDRRDEGAMPVGKWGYDRTVSE